MVVGDRGLVVREFSSRLGGVDRAAPSFSVLCDKVELGMPNGLKQLVAGDFPLPPNFLQRDWKFSSTSCSFDGKRALIILVVQL